MNRKCVRGQVSFFDGVHPLKITKPIRLIELFAGIGAQAKALENLGVQFEHYRICEFDKYAVKSYNAVHGTDFAPSDITKISEKDLGIEETDRYTYIMTYSFPCTDLSSAGKQKGMGRDSGTRSGLLWEVERLLSETEELPQILLMENVPEVVSDKNIKDFAQWIAFLDGKGYTSKYEILNAKNFGIPQNRARCFMVSWLGDYYYDFPTSRLPDFPTSRLSRLSRLPRLIDVLESRVDRRFYLSAKAASKLRINENWYSPFVNVERERERTVWCSDEQTLDTQENGLCRNADGKRLQGVREPVHDGGSGMGIVVAGSVNPEKSVQDRARILSPYGICQGLRATDYKDPPKIIHADGIYLSVSSNFQRGPLFGLSRALKAASHDAGVILYE